ncbi:MAG: endonuclease III domain-containing protein [Planctomycetes bacterium]|nr:endonuclease III domain-containing protein [Planctomycetota bacterium]
MTDSHNHTLRAMYDRLWSAYGPQHWWPTDTGKAGLRTPARRGLQVDAPTEVVIGAILTQNTAWINVERAIANLKQAAALDFKVLRDLPESELAELIRPSGTFRLKARRLKAFVDRLWDLHDGSLESLLAGEIETARRRLLDIPGIGPETADAILLYAGDRPTFVVDAYTMRVLRRHFIVTDADDYESVRANFHDALPREAALFNEYHALFVEVGKRHCRVRARCDGCPLADLPHDEGL